MPPESTSETAGSAPRQLARRAETLDSIAAYHAGIVWPRHPGVGSLEDQLASVRKTDANGFIALQGLLETQRIVAVTPAKGDQAQPRDAERQTREMVRSMLSAHRPQLVICVCALQAQEGESARGNEQSKNADRPKPQPWQTKFALAAAHGILQADGTTQSWPLAEGLRKYCEEHGIALASWHESGSTSPKAREIQLRVDHTPRIVREVCVERDVPCLALGIVRYAAGEGPSRELADYRESDSRAKKLGRMLRWTVKNRGAIRETANAAQDDLRAGDKLAITACEIVRALPGLS